MPTNRLIYFIFKVGGNKLIDLIIPYKTMPKIGQLIVYLMPEAAVS